MYRQIHIPAEGHFIYMDSNNTLITRGKLHTELGAGGGFLLVVVSFTIFLKVCLQCSLNTPASVFDFRSVSTIADVPESGLFI
jgi:hypothetical protein